MVRCWKCKSEMEGKVAEEFAAGISLGKFEHFACKCGEKVFSLETTEKMEGVAKVKGAWGLSSETKFSKRGKSIGIRIPARIVNLFKIHSGETAEILPDLKKQEMIIKV